ncbi:MAG: ECF transporter S component [Clostridia bacterium]|nr:ECF transporter S component [Clostridia bacterium]
MKKLFRFNARYLAWTAVFAALATALQFIEVGIPIVPSFLKLDFSEMPALVAGYALGPISGVIVCLIKNLITLSTSYSGGVGELSNFILGVLFVVPASLVYKYRRTRVGALIGAILGTVISSFASVLTNYYIVYPVYYNIMDEATILNMYSAIYPDTRTILRALFIFNLPFTAGKFIIDSLITFILYKRLSYFIKNGFRKRNRRRDTDDNATEDSKVNAEDNTQEISDDKADDVVTPNPYIEPYRQDNPIIVYSEQNKIDSSDETKE